MCVAYAFRFVFIELDSNFNFVLISLILEFLFKNQIRSETIESSISKEVLLKDDKSKLIAISEYFGFKFQVYLNSSTSYVVGKEEFKGPLLMRLDNTKAYPLIKGNLIIFYQILVMNLS